MILTNLLPQEKVKVKVVKNDQLIIFSFFTQLPNNLHM